MSSLGDTSQAVGGGAVKRTAAPSADAALAQRDAVDGGPSLLVIFSSGLLLLGLGMLALVALASRRAADDPDAEP